ncbi:hypothetical protein PbJCM13498_23810 [Prolixibacter bellariivorans]|uniref:Uncharacterized protein n=1 Tax=Prolixibacter bellariivorans TaxID=314319 RepID=A0A5M4B0K6_9BACT|nr:hypothetical protein PbJCM13498_23810 [Prolixibacter bellariivorans]
MPNGAPGNINPKSESILKGITISVIINQRRKGRTEINGMMTGLKKTIMIGIAFAIEITHITHPVMSAMIATAAGIRTNTGITSAGTESIRFT